MMAIPHERMPQSVMCETQYGYIQFRDSIQNEQVYRLLTGCRWATPHLEIGEETEDVVDAITQAQWRYAQKHFPLQRTYIFKIFKSGVRYKHIHAMVYQ